MENRREDHRENTPKHTHTNSAEKKLLFFQKGRLFASLINVGLDIKRSTLNGFTTHFKAVFFLSDFLGTRNRDFDKFYNSDDNRTKPHRNPSSTELRKQVFLKVTTKYYPLDFLASIYHQKLS